MKTLSILGYVIGSILLIVSCFISGVIAMWILDILAVIFLIAGCVFQYYANKIRKERENQYTNINQI